jgi:hypothetical protein
MRPANVSDLEIERNVPLFTSQSLPIMAANNPRFPRRGGIHSLYGIYMGGSPLESKYNLSASLVTSRKWEEESSLPYTRPSKTRQH